MGKKHRTRPTVCVDASENNAVRKPRQRKASMWKQPETFEGREEDTAAFPEAPGYSYIMRSIQFYNTMLIVIVPFYPAKESWESKLGDGLHSTAPRYREKKHSSPSCTGAKAIHVDSTGTSIEFLLFISDDSPLCP
ncbi:UNVERIFIED_CONTAM: hypothetical protein K2H54_030920 [Gekko kuhli]